MFKLLQEILALVIVSYTLVVIVSYTVVDLNELSRHNYARQNIRLTWCTMRAAYFYMHLRRQVGLLRTRSLAGLH